MKLKKIIELVKGEAQNIPSDYWEGDFSNIRTLEDASEQDITFIYDKKYLGRGENSKAALLIVPFDLVNVIKRPIIAVDNPRLAVLQLLNNIFPAPESKQYIAPSAVISETARIGKNVCIGHYSVIEENVVIDEGTIIEAHVYIGKNVSLGKSCRIHAGVMIYKDCHLGKEVILHSGVVIGSDGFGYLQQEGKNLKFPQVGRVIIGDDVEIGANSAVDRGALGDTCIGENTKIDNLVQIAHNVKIGKSCIIAGSSAIAGSVTIEDNVIIAGQVGVRDNIIIRKGAIIPGRTGVTGDVAEKTVVRPEIKRIIKLEGRLDKHGKKIEKIEKSLEDSS